MDTKDKIISLFQTGDDDNINLALELEKSQDVDVSKFWGELGGVARHSIYSWDRIIDYKKYRIDFMNSKRINLSLSDTTSIPIGLKYFKNITLLDLSHNKLIKIPYWLYDMKNLRTLTLCNNPIKYISKDIGKLTNLEVLNIRNTNVTDIASIQRATNFNIYIFK